MFSVNVIYVRADKIRAFGRSNSIAEITTVDVDHVKLKSKLLPDVCKVVTVDLRYIAVEYITILDTIRKKKANNLFRLLWNQQRHPYLAPHDCKQLQSRHNGRNGVSNHQPHHCLLNNLFRQAQIKENVKALRYWPLCGEFTGNRWIPHTKGQ